MQIYTNSNSIFPDQAVPVAEKNTEDYGLAVGRAIEGEWFRNYRGAGYQFYNNYTWFNTLRLYARAEQPVQKYKDELAVNGDLSYLNLDWKPVPVIPKFVDIVVNGMSQRTYDVKTLSQDPESRKQRTEYAQKLLQDIQLKQYYEAVSQLFPDTQIANFEKTQNTPETTDEIPMHLQLTYKQSIEIAEEEVIDQVLAKNKYDLTRKRLNEDLVILGIAAVKTTWNKSEGVVVDYCDPSRMVWSYTEDPNFEDLYYVGEIKYLTIPELKKQFPQLGPQDIETIEKYKGNEEYMRGWNGRYDNNTVQVLYFEYKTFVDQVFKIKETHYGMEKALEKEDTFLPPENDSFKRVSRTIEVLYEGAKILGHPMMLKWNQAFNMTRPLANSPKVNMNYQICAPKMYRGRIESLVSRITGFADMIQLTHLKIQQVLARMVPDGVYLDVDGLAEVDLGNGTNYNPAEALNMYFQTGSVIGRSLTQEGELNRGKIPVQELQSSSGGAKIQSLIQTYQYYLQMIRDTTGLNEARDGSLPDRDSLVGLQKLAAANSNTATRHILQASLYLTLKACENISRRVSDSLMFPLTRIALQDSITTFNTATLDELASKELHDFGIYIELEPDDEDKAKLEENIQVALRAGGIDLEDAIDIRNVNNIKLANQLLKKRRQQKQAREEQLQQQNIQMQAQANQETAEKAAMYEVQKQQALTQSSLQIEQGKSQFEIQRMQAESQIKRELMELEFQYNMQLTKAKVTSESDKINEIENRKDQRTKIQATQQSEMIQQRQQDGLPKDFESQGNDTIDGSFGLEAFGPR